MTNTNATQPTAPATHPADYNGSGFTYGDTLELPGVPGILWRVIDRRDVENIADETKARAELVPVDPENPDSWYAGSELVVKIGRAERKGVEIALRMGRRYDRATDSVGELEPMPWATHRRLYDAVPLTDAQQKLLETAAVAVPFFLPAYTPAEIAERIKSRATSAGERAAHEFWGILPDRFAGHGERGNRAIVSDALTAEVREEIAQAAAAAYLERVRESLKRY